MFARETLRDLAAAEPAGLVVSIYALTDPRDPANTASTPAWHIAMRNGLRTISEWLEAEDDRDDRLAFRRLRERIEQELVDLAPAKRARSVAWFLDLDGANSRRFSLQLPLRDNDVVADRKPFVSPLVDIADRGARTGVILVGGDLVRLLQIEQAEPSEPANSIYELSLGDWRSFGGTAGGSQARGLLTVSHQERYEARVDAQRAQLFETAATQTAKRLRDLGRERIVLVSERQVATRFRHALPAEISELVIAEADLNLHGEAPTAIADALEPLIEDAWLTRTTALVKLAHDRARAGGAATLGAQETLGARRGARRSSHPRSRPRLRPGRNHDPTIDQRPCRHARRASRRDRDRHRGTGHRPPYHGLGDPARRRRHGRATALLTLPRSNRSAPGLAVVEYISWPPRNPAQFTPPQAAEHHRHQQAVA